MVCNVHRNHKAYAGMTGPYEKAGGGGGGGGGGGYESWGRGR